MATKTGAAKARFLSNSSGCALGATQIIDGTKKVILGKAHLTEGLSTIWNSVFFAQDGDKKVAFTLADLKGKFSKAQTDALLTEACQLPTTTPKEDLAKVASIIKSRAVYGAAAYLAAHNKARVDDPIRLVGKHFVNVPVNVAITMRDDDGKDTPQGKEIIKSAKMILAAAGNKAPTAKQVGDQLNNSLIDCDGTTSNLWGKHPATLETLSQLSDAAYKQGMIKEKEKREGRTPKRDSKTFTASLKMVQDVMSSQFVLGETEVNLTVSLRAKLNVLKVSLENYFKANPMKDDTITE